MFRALDLEIVGEMRREVLTIFLNTKIVVNPYFRFWLVRENMVKTENYHTKIDSLYKL